MPLDPNRFPIRTPAESARLAAEAAAAKEALIARWTVELTSKVGHRFGDDDLTAAAVWLSQWQEDLALAAIAYSPYPIAPRTEAVLNAYLAALRAGQTVVTCCVEGEEPVTLPLADFFDGNADGIESEERTAVVAALESRGLYHGGGGAAPAWSVRLADAKPQTRAMLSSSVAELAL